MLSSVACPASPFILLIRSSCPDRQARLPITPPHLTKADHWLRSARCPDNLDVVSERHVQAPCATAHKYAGPGTTGKHAQAWHRSTVRPGTARQPSLPSIAPVPPASSCYIQDDSSSPPHPP